ncbi:MAG: hypothetical protein ACI8YP_003112 [Algoriphagus sp.]|jgi:hypothetical protein
MRFIELFNSLDINNNHWVIKVGKISEPLVRGFFLILKFKLVPSTIQT